MTVDAIRKLFAFQISPLYSTTTPSNMMRALILVAIIATATAFSSYRGTFPNGRTNAENFPPGHIEPSGSGPLDVFGQDYQNDPNWLQSLCQEDSDNDGQRNGLELGDPCCHWTPNAPELHNDPSDPSDANSGTNVRITAQSSSHNGGLIYLITVPTMRSHHQWPLQHARRGQSWL